MPATLSMSPPRDPRRTRCSRSTLTTPSSSTSTCPAWTGSRCSRARGVAAPVLVITARDTLDDRIRGLDAGSDDYLVKPFDLRELEARLRALLRRGTGAAARVEIGSVVLDTAARRVFVAGEPLALPPREFALLEALMLQPGKVVSKAKLATQLSAWGDEPLAPNALEVFVHRLRKKLENAGLEIRTLRGMGYMIEKPDG